MLKFIHKCRERGVAYERSGTSPFRSAAFGGFNRRDVLNYIESSARAYREKVADLQGERDQAVQSAQTAEAAAQEAQDRIGALEAELAAAKKALCQKSGALEAAETALGRERADPGRAPGGAGRPAGPGVPDGDRRPGL